MRFWQNSGIAVFSAVVAIVMIAGTLDRFNLIDASIEIVFISISFAGIVFWALALYLHQWNRTRFLKKSLVIMLASAIVVTVVLGTWIRNVELDDRYGNRDLKEHAYERVAGSAIVYGFLLWGIALLSNKIINRKQHINEPIST